MQKVLPYLCLLFFLLFISLASKQAFAEKKPSSFLYTTIVNQQIMFHLLALQEYRQVLGTKAQKKFINPYFIHKELLHNSPKATINQQPQLDTTSFIVQGINAYRAKQGLSAVQMNGETCAFATTRATEIVSSFTHDGFTGRLNAKTLPYKSWSKVTENIAMTSNYQEVVTLWENSPGHAENMRADTPFVCVEQSGNYFAYEGMKP